MHSIRGRLTGRCSSPPHRRTHGRRAPRPPSTASLRRSIRHALTPTIRKRDSKNKIAHLVARDLNATVINYWWPSRRGVLRNSILGGFCDVMIRPGGPRPGSDNEAYYRSHLLFRVPRRRGLQLRSLDDTILKRLKIGVNMIGYD